MVVDVVVSMYLVRQLLPSEAIDWACRAVCDGSGIAEYVRKSFAPRKPWQRQYVRSQRVSARPSNCGTMKCRHCQASGRQCYASSQCSRSTSRLSEERLEFDAGPLARMHPARSFSEVVTSAAVPLAPEAASGDRH